MARTEEHDKRYTNPDNDARGPWSSSDMSARNYYSQGTYSITAPSGRIIAGPPKGMYWRVSKDTFEEMNKNNRIWWGKAGNNVPRIKRFLSEVQEGVVPQTIWFHQEVGNTQEAKKEIVKIIPDDLDVFITPKPTRLLKRIFQLATNSGDLVLDSFAGSGTTGDAVLQLNKDDGGNRRFILIEIDKNISQNITAERLKRVIQGYTYNDQKDNKKKEAGFGGDFRFCEMGVTLFDADGQIHAEVKYNDLAQHVYFVETGQPLPNPPPFPKGKGAVGPLLGIHKGTAVYLLYNGILKDKKPNGGNVLTRVMLQSLPKHDGPKIIYGTGCLLSEEKLRELGIAFRQIPYEVKAS